MSEFHRKIELQSPDDLQYLVGNIRRAADAEIERNLPRMEGEGEDEMRTRVEQLVDEYITTILHTTATNLSINGLPADGDLVQSILQNKSIQNPANNNSIEEHEPFNSKLFAKAKDLATKEDELVEEIAKLRREVPRSVREGVEARWRSGMDEDEALLRGVDERLDGENEAGRGIQIGNLERQNEVEQNWSKGVNGLGRMVGTLPESVAKKERAERVEAFVSGGR